MCIDRHDICQLYSNTIWIWHDFALSSIPHVNLSIVVRVCMEN